MSKMLNTIFESFNQAIRSFEYDYIYIDSIFLTIWLGFLIKYKKGNAIIGNGLAFNSKNCFIHSDDDLIALVDMNDLIVVKSENAILICPKDKTQKAKELVELIQRKKMSDYL